MDNPLSGYWSRSGIEKGDVVLIHSSMKRAFRAILSKGHKPDPRLVVESLLDELGNQGTLLLPLFNFDFADGKSFSLNDTPSQMGVITEFARTNFDGVRTGHPIYSFYAIGKLAGEFTDIDNFSGYGPDSPFAKLMELDGKIGCVDLEDQNSMTFYHFVEEALAVDYRYFKNFSGSYQSQSGAWEEKTYALYVRNLEAGIETFVNPMGELLWSEGLYAGTRPNVGNGMRTISSRKLFERTSKVIESGRALGTLYRINLG